MRVVVFEDDGWGGFGPLSALRHGSQLRWGTRTLLDSLVESIGGASETLLWGREVVSSETKSETAKSYNESPKEPALYLNARARPAKGLLELTSRQAPFIAVAGGHLVAARLPADTLKPGVVKKSDVTKAGKKVEELDVGEESLFSGYWDLVESNGLAIAEQASRFAFNQSVPSQVELRGPPSSLKVADTADIEHHVTFDVRLGPVVVGEGASVESFSRVMGPTFIGDKSKLYSAQIGGGTSIFEGCKVGGQVENSVMLPHSNKAHHGYVGDSYVGEWVNLGAGSTFSNLKNTYGNVRVTFGGKRHDSGSLKLGPAIGDMCKVSIGAQVHAGKLVGTGSYVAGPAGENVPSFTFYDGITGKKVELLVDSVVETQRRMMERRGLTLTRVAEELIRKTFSASSGERGRAGVRRGRIG